MKKGIRLLVYAILTLGFMYLYFISKDNSTEVNKQTCAVWGYEEDCKTPLK